MILYEYEGKKLLSQAGINIPKGQLIESVDQEISINAPLMLKAQVLSGKRAQAGGIIRIQNSELGIKEELQKLLGRIINKEKVEKVLVEEMVEVETEFYISLSYDTDTRGPILSLSQQGGSGVEERKVSTYPVDPISFSSTAVEESEIPENLLEKLINLFFEQDCLLLEINPLVKTTSGIWVALDAKIKLDDDARSRHPQWDFTPRGVPGYTPTANEIAAKKIDEGDYRGVAGSTYFDLPGDIAIMSSGGGVSLTAMDALIAAGGKPANFTEYSGNPPKEKVIKLTKIVLNKPNIHGLWVIGTVAANFTDIYETLSGLIDGLREAQEGLGQNFHFPIVIRRGGPRDGEAFEILRAVKDFDLHLQGKETTITQSAQTMAKLAEEFAQKEREK